MADAAVISKKRTFWQAVWLGPLFVKELLATSRRVRYYALRAGYILVLTLFVMLVWMAATEGLSEGMGVYGASRMGVAGRRIVGSLLWFQFFGAVVATAAVLSASISGEVGRRTFIPLMMTPLNAYQVVVGKFLGGLLHVLVLLAVSLPLLALVRVFGAVPWKTVVGGVVVTLTASLVVGAMAMMFSVLFRWSALTILCSVVGLFVVCAAMSVLGLLVGMITTGLGGNFGNGVAFASPLGGMVALNYDLENPGSLGTVWPLLVVNALVSLGAVALFLAMATRLVRRVSLGRALGSGAAATPAVPMWGRSLSAAPITTLQPVMPPPQAVAARPVPEPATEDHEDDTEAVVLQPARPAAVPPPAPEPQPISGLNDQPVPETPSRKKKVRQYAGGSPIVWKDLRRTELRSNLVIIAACVGYPLLAMAYAAAIMWLGDAAVQAGFVIAYLVLGALGTAVCASTSIPVEREAKVWPLLLMTGLSDWHILFAKAYVVFKRTQLVWITLAAHVLLFTVIGFMPLLAIVHLLLLLAGMWLLLVGLGFYFGTTIKRSSLTVLATLGVVAVIWVILPVLLQLVGAILQPGADRWWLTDVASIAHPISLVTVVVAGGNTDGLFPTTYEWPFGELDPVTTSGVVLLVAVVYSATGLLLTHLAQRKFRTNAF
jgi:ABC-type transport system involved in multi-copper enzyme maturation permease subunit